MLHTRGNGNLIWSTLTWSMRGKDMRLGKTMREEIISMMVSSDRELEGNRWDLIKECFTNEARNNKMLEWLCQDQRGQTGRLNEKCYEAFCRKLPESRGVQKIGHASPVDFQGLKKIRISQWANHTAWLATVIKMKCLRVLTGRRMKKKVTPPTSGAWPMSGSRMTLIIPWSCSIQDSFAYSSHLSFYTCWLLIVRGASV